MQKKVAFTKTRKNKPYQGTTPKYSNFIAQKICRHFQQIPAQSLRRICASTIWLRRTIVWDLSTFRYDRSDMFLVFILSFFTQPQIRDFMGITIPLPKRFIFLNSSCIRICLKSKIWSVWPFGWIILNRSPKIRIDLFVFAYVCLSRKFDPFHCTDRVDTYSSRLEYRRS